MVWYSRTFRARDGDEVTEQGYEILDQDGETVYDEDLEDFNGIILPVAGVSHRQDALQHDAFEPGRRVRFVRDPGNKADRNAVEVWDAERKYMIGFVPREHAPDIGRRVRQGNAAGLIIREFRNGRGQRTGIRILVADEIESWAVK